MPEQTGKSVAFMFMELGMKLRKENREKRWDQPNASGYVKCLLEKTQKEQLEPTLCKCSAYVNKDYKHSSTTQW